MTALAELLPRRQARALHSQSLPGQIRGWGLSNRMGGGGCCAGPMCVWHSGMGNALHSRDWETGVPIMHPQSCQSNPAPRAVPGLTASAMSSPSGSKLHSNPSPTSGVSGAGTGPWSLRGTAPPQGSSFCWEREPLVGGPELGSTGPATKSNDL